MVVAHTLAPRMLARSEYGDRRRQCEACARTAAAAFPGVRTLRDVTRGQLLELKPNLDPLVHRRGLFIIEEDARVPEFAEALAGGDLARLGALTGESFEGARGLFEITVPAMVELRDAMLRAPGAIGARQAGAGFGGCMVALVESNRSADFVAALARSYYAPRGKDPVVHVVTAAPGAGIVPVPSSRP